MNSDDNFTLARAWRDLFLWSPFIAVAGVVAVFVVLPVILVGWLAGGWFQAHTIQRQYSNTVNSQPYQQSLLAEMQRHQENITGPGGLAATRSSLPASSSEQLVVRAQELDEVGQLCAESVNFVPGIAPGSQQFASIISANCLAGTPVSAPPLANPVPAGN